EPIENAEVLVVDELGAQSLRPWAADVLYDLVNRRYSRRLPTLFTTNYRLDDVAPQKPPVRVAGRTTMVPRTLDRGPDAESPREELTLLSSRLPAMLVSRLYEMAQPVALGAVEDFRREHAVHGAHLR
ncbi:MAG TPA: hypothetical protein VLE27_03440, partial [Thermoanaerobaculia bacterium]|nr:hypothetical protein [Thermoanaerobaculia bacterium]